MSDKKTDTGEKSVPLNAPEVRIANERGDHATAECTKKPAGDMTDGPRIINSVPPPKPGPKK